jgi:hypothetical protein
MDFISELRTGIGWSLLPHKSDDQQSGFKSNMVSEPEMVLGVHHIPKHLPPLEVKVSV